MPHSFDDTAQAEGLQPPARLKGGRTDRGQRHTVSQVNRRGSSSRSGAGAHAVEFHYCVMDGLLRYRFCSPQRRRARPGTAAPSAHRPCVFSPLLRAGLPYMLACGMPLDELLKIC